MIKKDVLKGYVLGALSMVMISATVFAAPVQKNITAAYNNLKIYVDGDLVETQGNKEPFIYEGTTFLPLRAVCEALGKEVKWDEDTKSVYISGSVKQKEVTVSNAEEFVKAIGSNKKIILKPGTYNLSLAANKVSNENVIWEEVVDGFRLQIRGANNLTIEGEGNTPVDIVAEPRYGEIFHINECQNITFKNIKAGHTIIPDSYECNAGVLYIQNSQNISVLNSILYGCGSEGIFTDGVIGLNMDNSVIEKCNLRVMDLLRSEDITFTNCKFRECKNESMFSFYDIKNVVFNFCEVSGNTSKDKPLIEFMSLDGGISKDVKFLNTKFENNIAAKLCNSKIDTEGSTFEGNSFDKKEDVSVSVPEEIVVSNAEELVKAIDSNKKIILKSGTYNISSVANKVSNPNITWEEVYDGLQLRISGVNNLTIQGEGNTPVDILAEPRLAEVFSISDCENITFKNIRAGHTTIPEKNKCNAGVLNLQNSHKITILDSVLFGCGSEGIYADGVIGLNMENSIIEKCNYRVMDLMNSQDAKFTNCKFRECGTGELFAFLGITNVVFSGCVVSDNVSEETSMITFMGDASLPRDVKFFNTKFKNNKASNLCDSVVDTEGSTFEGNSFDKK